MIDVVLHPIRLVQAHGGTMARYVYFERRIRFAVRRRLTAIFRNCGSMKPICVVSVTPVPTELIRIGRTLRTSTGCFV